jgi:uncharacterized protein (TIGR00369 family)
MTGTDLDAGAGGRTRTYSWDDQTAFLAAAKEHSGAEVLAMMSDGRIPLPPVAATMNFESFDLADGVVTVTLKPEEFHYNPLGIVHGGVIAMLLDTVAGCAVHATLPAGVGYASVDLTVKFLRPVTTSTGLVTAVGRVTHQGSRTSLAEATLSDADGRLLATAISTCMTLA